MVFSFWVCNILLVYFWYQDDQAKYRQLELMHSEKNQRSIEKSRDKYKINSHNDLKSFACQSTNSGFHPRFQAYCYIDNLYKIFTTTYFYKQLAFIELDAEYGILSLAGKFVCPGIKYIPTLLLGVCMISFASARGKLSKVNIFIWCQYLNTTWTEAEFKEKSSLCRFLNIVVNIFPTKTDSFIAQSRRITLREAIVYICIQSSTKHSL